MKNLRFGAVVLTATVMLSMATAGAAMAGDHRGHGIVFDGVARVVWVDRVDGVMDGAQVRIEYYHEGDEVHGIMPAFITSSRGVAYIMGVPRAAEGDAPVLLDIRADLSTATLDEAGCMVFQDFIAQRNMFKSRERALVLLQTTFRSEPAVSCP